MKKIVALVLSLVMVLGLATTAFGAVAQTALTGTYDLYSVNTTDDEPTYEGRTLTPYKAATPKDSNDDGLLDTTGNIKWYDVSGCGFVLVQVNTVAEADWVVKYNTKDTLLGYFAAYTVAETEYVGSAVAYKNFGEDCGQFDFEPEEDVDYYLVADIASVNSGIPAVFADVGADGGYSFAVKVGNELVYLAATDAEYVAHSPVFTYDKDYKVVAVKCEECGVVANIYKNYLSIPEADIKADNVGGNVNGTEYFVWTNAVEAPAADADKVESAQTFDAGIAMYVGMSVMAAAGSAVVLKKKD